MTEQRFPWEQGVQVAEDLQQQLAPYCERIVIAGSIRRQKATVKDVELLCIPERRAILDSLNGGQGDG